MNKSDSKHYVLVNNRKCFYKFLPSDDEGAVRFVCEAAGIDQNFLKEDISELLIDLPALIIDEIEYLNEQDQVIRFRVSKAQKKDILKKALKKGYKNVSSFLRDLAMKA